MSAVGAPPVENRSKASDESAERIAPFTVEVGDDSNRTITINTLTMRLRGRYSLSNLFSRKDPSGKRMTGRNVGDVMTQMPDIPGIRLEVDPGKSSVRIYDPLEGDKDRCDEINRVLSSAVSIGSSSITFVPEKTVTLDKDQLKTLCIEVVQHVRENSARVVSGSLPSQSAVNRLPGKKLYDPWSSDHTKPRYEEDVPEWQEQMRRRA